MTFLELCRAAASECDVSLTGPSATTSQTGRLGQIVSWVNKSWVDLQTKRNDWRWMVGEFTVNTVAGTRKYASTACTDTATSAAIANFREWDRDSFQCYLASSGQGTAYPLPFINYHIWHQSWNVGSPAVSTNRVQPNAYTFDNDRSILLAGYPDAVYTITGRFRKSATELSGDSDTPGLPSEYHMAIVYRTMMKYGRYVGAAEVFNDGQANYQRMLREIIRTQTLPPLVGGPLA